MLGSTGTAGKSSASRKVINRLLYYMQRIMQKITLVTATTNISLCEVNNVVHLLGCLIQQFFRLLTKSRQEPPNTKLNKHVGDCLERLRGLFAAEESRSPEAYSIGSIRHLLLTEDLPRVRVAVITGGPSAEAAISLNSARTVLDMLRTRPLPDQAAELRDVLESVRPSLFVPFSLSQ